MPVRGFVAVLVIVVAIAASWYVIKFGQRLNHTAGPVSGGITGAIRPAAGPDLPTFDLVRVDTTGQTVVSGLSAAGAKVTLTANGKPLGTATANERGEWVVRSRTRLISGATELDATAVDASGAAQAASQVVLVDIPRDGKPPMAVLKAGGSPSRVLLGPDEPAPMALAVTHVDYYSDGRMLISGHAPALTSVRIYLDNQPYGVAKADAKGDWVLEPRPVAAGAYTMRIDQLGPKGSVIARSELPFQRADPALAAAAILGSKTLAIVANNQEWRIARALAGSDLEYTVVYFANQGQIRDPSLIYPGQIFEQPEASEK